MQINKKYLKSKTLYAALLVALVPLFPEAEAFIKENPDMVMYAMAGIFGALRVVTKDSLWGNSDKTESLE